jgi:hypothetical protein
MGGDWGWGLDRVGGSAMLYGLQARESRLGGFADRDAGTGTEGAGEIMTGTILV